jgi:phenylacetic acid degradation operon negative regulatory protein
MQHTAFQDLLTELTADQTPRVWSLLVTVFGELAQEEGARIESKLLAQLMPLMGVKPEAMRVALHRLRKDGWLESERSGRNSSYFLTDLGRTQSAKATPRIYGLEAIPEQAWLVLFDPSQPVKDHDLDGKWIASNLLVTATPVAHDQAFSSPILKGQSLPSWMQHRVCDPEIMRLTKEFHDRLTHLETSIKHVDALDCFEISALRILIVDRWRRIILKTPSLPEHVFPNTWAGQLCRQRVDALLKAYKKQDLEVLEAAL